MPHQCTNCGHVFEDGSKEMLSGCPDCGGNKFQYHPGEVPDETPAEGTDSAEPPEPPEPEGGSVSGAVGRAANRVRDAVSSGPPSTTDGDESAVDASTSDPAVEETTDAVGDTEAESAADASEATGESAAETTADSTADTTADSAVETPEETTTADETKGGQSLDDAAAQQTDPDAEPGVDAAPADSEDGAQAEARSEVVDMTSLPDRAEDGRVVKEPDTDTEDRPDLEDLRQELNDQFESIRIVAPGQYELNLMELYDRQEYIIALQEDGQYVIEVPDAWEAPDPTETE
jgi:predicted  nucleic acid-binding Zn-ribbon protein